MMAARLASSGAAHEEALANIDNALSLIEGERRPRAAELHAARAVALRSLSRFAEAVDSYERAISLFIEEGNAAAVAEASSHLCYIHLWNVDDSRALTVVDRALSLLGSDISPSRHRLLLCKALSLSVGHTEASLATLSEAKLIEAALLEARADGFASMCEARVAWGSAQFDWADQCAREARARFRATGNLWGEAELFEPIAAALCLGRPTDAEPLLRESLSRAERVGHHGAAWACKSFASILPMARGDLEEAERSERDAFVFGQSFSVGWCFGSPGVLGCVAYYRGQFDAAARWFRSGLEIEPVTYLSGLLAGGLFWSLAAKGDPDAGAALAKARLYLPVPGRQLSVGACGCLGFTVEGLAWLGRDAEAAALQPHAEHVVANGLLCFYSLQQFRSSAGIAAACASNWSRAEEHHGAAIHQADTVPYRVAQPMARYWCTRMLLARGEPGDQERARVLLGEAVAMYESMGMAWHARHAVDRMAGL